MNYDFFSSKFAHASPFIDQKETTVANFLVKDWLINLQIPKRIHGVQERNFGSCFVQLCNYYNTEKSHTTPYHPEGNGQCERFNRILHDRLWTKPPEKKWPEYSIFGLH